MVTNGDKFRPLLTKAIICQRHGSQPMIVDSFFKMMNSKKPSPIKSERSFVVIAIGCVVFLSLIFYGARTYYVRQDDFIKPIINADINETDEIIIRPWNAFKNEYNLVKNDISVKSFSSKAKILTALNVAEPFSSSHPHSKWTCVLTLKKKGEKYSCTVSSSKNMGVLINFWSFGGYWGFHLGEYRSDSLGKILELIANNNDR